MRTAANFRQRISAILLTIAMVVVTVLTGLASIPANAAEVATTAKIRLTGIDAELAADDDDVGYVWGYPIVQDSVDANGNHSWSYGANNTAKVKEWLNDSTKTLALTELYTIYGNLNTTTHIVGEDEHDIAHDGFGDAVVQGEAQTDAKGKSYNSKMVAFVEDPSAPGQYVSTEAVPAGLYVIAANRPASSASSKSYNPTLVAVNYSYDTNGQVNGIEGRNGNGEVVFTVKSSDSPVLDKVVVNTDNTTAKHQDSKIGDVVNFKITVTIPDYGDAWNTDKLHYQIKDTLTDGLTLDASSIKIGEQSFDEFKTADATSLSSTTSGFTLDLKGADVFSHKNTTLEITYSATINSNAGVNFDEETNTATLSYSTSSNSEDLSEPTEKKTHHYTFGFDTTVNGSGSATTTEITKYGINSTTTNQPIKLQGAKFQLFYQTDTSRANPLHFTEAGQYSATAEGTTLTTGADGQLTATGLEEGSYILKEYQAPNGYSLDTTEYPVVITGEYDDEGVLTNYTVKVGNGDNAMTFSHVKQENNDIVVTDGTFAINNIPLSNLPATGGRGIIIVTIIAAIMMAGFGSAFIMLKNGKAKKN